MANTDSKAQKSDDESQQRSRITNVDLGAEKGVLSSIGDPLGKGLETGLKPIGNVVGGLTQGVTGPSTDLVRGAGQALGGAGSQSVAASSGGNKNGQGTSGSGNGGGGGGGEQTADNPLGL